MSQESAEELTTRLSCEIVKDLAPRELPFFDNYKQKFLKNPQAFSEKDPKKKEKILGFGVGDLATQVLTSFVLPTVYDAICKYLAKRKEKKVEKLDQDQLTQIRKDAYDNAVAMGLEKGKAGLLADALVGKIMNL